MSSDVEMDDSSHPDSDVELDVAVVVAPDVLAAYKRGPDHLVHKGKHYDWRPHEDNARAFSKPSVIWQLGDEYETSECLKNWWDCGLIQQLQNANSKL